MTATVLRAVFFFAAASGLRVTLLLMITGMLALALRKRSAALQHGLWTGALAAAVLIPVVGVTLSKMGVTNPVGASQVLAAAWGRMAGATTASGLHERRPEGTVAKGPASAPRFNIDSVSGLSAAGSTTLNTMGEKAGALWLVGIAILLSRLLASNVAVARLRRRAVRVADRRVNVVWEEIVAQSARSVSLLQTDAINAPATAGIFRSSIFLPPESSSWTTAQLRAALTHEYAHVRRRDCLTQLVGDIAVAFYWVNPFVWYARRRMVIDRERACDDLVLGSGVKPTRYASILVETLRATLSSPSGTIGVLSMARPSEMETRLFSILDPTRDRHQLSVRGLLAPMTIVAASALLISASHLYAGSNRSGPDTDQEIEVPRPLSPPPGKLRLDRDAGQHMDAQLEPNGEPDRRTDSVASPLSERVRLEKSTLAAAPPAEVLHGPDSLFARKLVAGLSHTPSWEGDLVQDRSTWAISRQRSGRLIEPLIESLSDKDWRIRAYAAWALGEAGDGRAVADLLPLLKDPIWRMRAMAANALNQIGDLRATDAMINALHDEAWQVRVNAVEFVGARSDLKDVTLLRAALADQHVAVRQAAETAVRNQPPRS